MSIITVGNQISSQQTDSLHELRNRMKEDLEPDMYDDEHLLYRFLKARDFNVDKAEVMLRKHLEWRLKIDLKNILKFKKNEVMEKYVSYTIIGHDKEGCVVRYCPVGISDIIGIIASSKFDDLVKLMMHFNEIDTIELKKQSVKLGRNVEKCVYVYNMAKLTFAQAANKESIYLFLHVIHVFLNNYPERLKTAFIVNVSPYFCIAYNMMKPFIPKSVLGKVQILSNDSYQAELLKVVDADQLPAFLGGTMTDPDGNPLCCTLINQIGPVPETYYLQKSKSTLSKAPGVKKVFLLRAASHEVNFEVKEPGSYLEWEFETKSRDVGFGLYYRDTSDGEGNNVQIIPIHRIDTEVSSETGMFKCDKVGSYVLVFDNTYSWIRSKKIFYSIKVITPVEHEAQMPAE